MRTITDEELKEILAEHELWLTSGEIKVQKGLDHPNIVRCLEWMETERNFYLVLELVQGETMREYLKKR